MGTGAGDVFELVEETKQERHLEQPKLRTDVSVEEVVVRETELPPRLLMRLSDVKLEEEPVKMVTVESFSKCVLWRFLTGSQPLLKGLLVCEAVVASLFLLQPNGLFLETRLLTDCLLRDLERTGPLDVFEMTLVQLLDLLLLYFLKFSCLLLHSEHKCGLRLLTDFLEERTFTEWSLLLFLLCREHLLLGLVLALVAAEMRPLKRRRRRRLFPRMETPDLLVAALRRLLRLLLPIILVRYLGDFHVSTSSSSSSRGSVRFLVFSRHVL